MNVTSWFKRRQQQSALAESNAAGGTQEASTATRFAADLPIDARDADRFGRARFAVRVAETLAMHRDPNSVVVGIYGAWGEGKTSVLNIMKSQLSTSSKVVVATFNPWRFKSEDDLLLGFFQTLASALNEQLAGSGEVIGKALKEYGFLLTPASALVSLTTLGSINLKDISEKVGGLLDRSSLERRKRRIEEILTGAGVRVVVVIDDIDRLDRAEIQAIFKLVKLSAQFKNISYVLAFDDEIVAQSLGERYGAGDVDAGRRFIEKIIQVPLRLPRADQLELRKLALEGVEVALEEAGVPLSSFDASVFGRFFVGGFDSALKTPRQAKLYGNAILFALPLLKDEVNVGDLFLLEGIRVFFPPLHRLISENPNLFIPQRVERQREHSITVSEKIKAVLSLREERLDAVLELVHHLFPRTGSTGYGSDWEASWARDQRVCSAQYFDRFFSYGVSEGDIPDQLVASFIDAAGTEDYSSMLKIWERASSGDGGALERFIRKLREIEASIDQHRGSRIALFIAQHSNDISLVKRGPLDFAESQPAILIRKLVAKTPDEKDRFEQARDILLKCASLTYAGEVFRWFRTERDEGSERLLSESLETELGRLLARRIQENSIEAGALYLRVDHAPRLYWIWKEYGDAAALKDGLAQSFNTDALNVTRFLGTFVGLAWAADTGVPRPADFSREAYDAVAKLADPEIIMQRLQGLFGSDIGIGDYHWRDDRPLPERYAHQFAAIHKAVLEQQALQSATPKN